MIFRTHIVVGVLLAICLNAFIAEAKDDTFEVKRNLRSGVHEEIGSDNEDSDRELSPYGYRSTNVRAGNRYASNRGFGSLLGMQPQQPQYVRPPPKGFKSGKSSKTGKNQKGAKKGKKGKINPVSSRPNAQFRGAPQRTSYLGSQQFQRLPGQPIFISSSEIVGEETFFDADGNPIVVVGTEQFPLTPTAAPEPSVAPTRRPTNNPTLRPTRRPTNQPTKKPTNQPTRKPTRRPTRTPTRRPTRRPTRKPTREPTRTPTRTPTREPTQNPTKNPTNPPTVAP